MKKPPITLETKPKFYLTPFQVQHWTKLGYIEKDQAGVMRVVNVPFYSGIEVIENKLISL